jgi:phosphoribosyl 1,2-cyclic phosphodiesterase
LKFTSYASSSAGNLYAVDDGKTRLLLECGVQYRKILMHLNHDISRIAGCLLTHEHKDHSFAVKNIIQAGIDVYMTDGTRRQLILPPGPHVKVIEKHSVIYIGSYTVYPIPAYHDCAEGAGYAIRSSIDGETLLFSVDTHVIDTQFTGLNYLAAECNFDVDSIDANVDGIAAAVLKRIKNTHMSIQGVEDYLNAIDLTALKAVYLTHMSSSRGNAEEFVKRIKYIVGEGVEVVACGK